MHPHYKIYKIYLVFKGFGAVTYANQVLYIMLSRIFAKNNLNPKSLRQVQTAKIK